MGTVTGQAIKMLRKSPPINSLFGSEPANGYNRAHLWEETTKELVTDVPDTVLNKTCDLIQVRSPDYQTDP